MRLYISGPIKDTPNHKENFHFASNELDRAGYLVTSPIEISGCSDSSCLNKAASSHFSDGVHTWECYLRYDLIEMLKCDGIAMLDDWYNSKGALLEFTTGRAVGMPIRNVYDWIIIGTRHERPV